MAGAPSWILMMVTAFAAFLVLSGVGALIAMFIGGIVKNRPWMSLTAVGLGLLGFVGTGLLVALAVPAYHAAQRGHIVPGVETAVVHFSEPQAHIEWQGGPGEWHESESFGHSRRVSHLRVSFIPILVIIFGLGALAFALVKRMKAGASSCGRFPSGPQFAVIALAVLGMLMFAGVRSVERVSLAPPQAMRATMGVDEITRAAQQQVDEARQQAEGVQQAIEQQVEQINNANVSIEQLEEKFIAPKIPLAPEAPEKPQTPVDDSTEEKGQCAADSTTQDSSTADDASDASNPQEKQANNDDDESAPTDESSDAADEQPPVEASPGAESKVNETDSGDEARPGADESQSATNDNSDSDAGNSNDAKVVSIEAVESKSDNAAPDTDPQPAAVATISSKSDTSSAVKEMAASMASFAKAINRAVDEYTRAATSAAETDPAGEPPAVPAPAPAPAAAATIAESSAPRPKWIDVPPRRVGELHREVIATEEYVTVDECYRARDIYLLLKTYEHIQRLAGLPYEHTELPSLPHGKFFVNSNGDIWERDGDYDPNDWEFGHSRESVWNDPRLQTLQAMGITADYVQREIAKEEYIETNDRSFGPMKKLYTQIEFNSVVDDELRRAWNDHRREERFGVVGLGATVILSLLGMVWGMLKVDTMTKGYYTKRLFLGVPLGMLGLFGLIALAIEAL